MVWRLLPVRSRIAEAEENAVAPDPELVGAGDLLLGAEIDQIIKNRSHQPRLERATHEYIGCGLAARCGLDTQPIVRPRRHNVVQIGSEDQSPVAAFTGDSKFHRVKRNVLDLD